MKINIRDLVSGVRHPASRLGFTLVEMMVVVAVIGILVAGVFKLMGATGEANKRARTIQRMQKLENAIAGFHAKYGMYPPVPIQGSPDPFESEKEDGSAYSSVSTLVSTNANRAASCQSIRFSFPPARELDAYINVRFENEALSPNTQGSGAFTSSDWPKTRLFRFGLLSFLLPRLDTIGGSGFRKKDMGSDNLPKPEFFTDTAQWGENNLYRTQADLFNEDNASAETDICLRWLPHLKGIIWGGRDDFMGLNLNDGGEKYGTSFVVHMNADGSKYVYSLMTVKDGWGNDFYYHSAPPYQSYRLWSSGPDGKTFPADYPLTKLESRDQTTVLNWIKDDIVHSGR